MTKEEFKISAGKLVDAIQNQNSDALLEIIRNPLDLKVAILLCAATGTVVPQLVESMLEEWDEEQFNEAIQELSEYDDQLEPLVKWLEEVAVANKNE